MARQKKSADAERRAVVRAETSLLLTRNFCSKGERALPMQSGYLIHRAEGRAVSCAVVRAELRADVGAELLQEKMAQMQKSAQKVMQMPVQRHGRLRYFATLGL